MVTEEFDIQNKNIFFRRNGDRNYLVICNGDSPELPYQVNTIRYNKIEGLLPVQFFIEDGEYQYFYDISCKEALTSKMKLKKYTIREIRTILSDLYRCTKRMEDYLLDINGLMLAPDYIFCDQQNQYCFCYYPAKSMAFEKSLEMLFEYFMNHLDYEDEVTIQLVYTMYQRARENTIPFSELMKLFCDEKKTSVLEKNEELLSKTAESEKRGSVYADRGLNASGGEQSVQSKRNHGESTFYGRMKNKDSYYEDDKIFETDKQNGGEKKSKGCESEYIGRNQKNDRDGSDECKHKETDDLKKNRKKADVKSIALYIPDVIGGLIVACMICHISKTYRELSSQRMMLWLFGIAAIIVGCGILSAALANYMERELDNGKRQKKIKENIRKSERTASENYYEDIFEGGNLSRSEYFKTTENHKEFQNYETPNPAGKLKTEKASEFQEISFEETQRDRFDQKNSYIRSDRLAYEFSNPTGSYTENQFAGAGSKDYEKVYPDVRTTETYNRSMYHDTDYNNWNSAKEEKGDNELTAAENKKSYMRQPESRNQIPATVVMRPQMLQIFHPALISKDKIAYPDILLKENEMMIGKIRGIADICLESDKISRVHARMIQNDQGCSVVDLGSTNGTYINGKQIPERQTVWLKDGDTVCFADMEYIFKDIPENKDSHKMADVI